ncbi:hypothetical protein BS78_02G098400 [Paspalum vaginatum]|nr:hypothetical protein BS78_02G098400 [Paspalum vaginatum]
MELQYDPLNCAVTSPTQSIRCSWRRPNPQSPASWFLLYDCTYPSSVHIFVEAATAVILGAINKRRSDQCTGALYVPRSRSTDVSPDLFCKEASNHNQ